jgi:hypothetical protein
MTAHHHSFTTAVSAQWEQLLDSRWEAIRYLLAPADEEVTTMENEKEEGMDGSSIVGGMSYVKKHMLMGYYRSQCPTFVHVSRIWWTPTNPQHRFLRSHGNDPPRIPTD